MFKDVQTRHGTLRATRCTFWFFACHAGAPALPERRQRRKPVSFRVAGVKGNSDPIKRIQFSPYDRFHASAHEIGLVRLRVWMEEDADLIDRGLECRKTNSERRYGMRVQPPR